MYHDDTQYFGEDYPKQGSLRQYGQSLFINMTQAAKIATSAMQQFGRAMRTKPKSTYFDRVPAKTRLAKSTVFKRMRDLS